MTSRSVCTLAVLHRFCCFGAALLFAAACGSDRGDAPLPEFAGPVAPVPDALAPAAPAPGDEAPGSPSLPAADPGNDANEALPMPVLPPSAPPPGVPPASLPPASNTPPGEPAPPAPDTPEGDETPVGTHGQLRVEGTRLVGEDGAPVQLKGVSTMWLNWEPRYSVNRDGLRWMRDNWNVSLVRAAMGVEPDGAYLTDPEPAIAQLRTVVENAIDVGVYVLVDWHDHNAHLHRDQAIDFFSRVAAEFGGFPNVLYEPYNEPLNVSWSSVIKPYHEEVLRAIRAEDPDNVVILGTRSWSQRVDEAAADRVAGDNLMYTVHFYACDHREFQRNQANIAYEAGLPLFVTEWGATAADGGVRSATVCSAEAEAWLDWLGARSISWAAWKLDGCRDASCFFTSRQAPANGGWTDEWLNGHARFVIDHLRE
jgi:endoglucanase